MYIAINDDNAIALAVCCPGKFSWCEIFDTVNQNVWVGIPEDQRAELHHAYKTGEVENFRVGISAVEDT